MASTEKPAYTGEDQLKHLCHLLSHSFLRATPFSFTLGGNSEFQFLWIHKQHLPDIRPGDTHGSCQQSESRCHAMEATASSM